MNDVNRFDVTPQPSWWRECSALLASGLAGWSLEAWLCRYFWNHDVGILGGPLLLLGPPLVTLGTFALLHLLLLISFASSYARRPGPLIARLTFRGLGILFLLAANWWGLRIWSRWYLSVEQSLGRYVPHSKMAVPLGMHALVWLLTLLGIWVAVYVGRDFWNSFRRLADSR